MTIEAITAEILWLRDTFLDDADVTSYPDINSGLCADFADSIWRKFPQVDVLGIYELSDLEAFPTDDPMIIEAMTFEAVGHSFVHYKGKYFDSECPNGVNGPYDLPVIRRAILEWNRYA
jgi:hypothetical protein